jgi:diguanylate cyclase (GGDEF)-like protein
MPIGWLTTAGSNSAMVYYSILFLIVTFILISNRWEYIIPFLYIILIIFLMYLETKYPDHFYIYKSSTTRFYDISVHYVINVLVLSITTIILKYKYSFEHLKYIELSNRDALTGLYNRRYITDRLRREYKKSKTENLDFCIIMIDIDNFKKVNDIYGHQAGDDVLIKLANSFIVNSRSSDICGRYGGDEFIIILPNCSESNAKQYSERVQNTFDEICKCYQDTGLSISFGISNNRLSSVHDIIKNADLKLYNNKLLKKKLSALEGEYTNEQI